MQYRRIWKWTQKGKLFLVIFLITSKSFTIFGHRKIVFMNFEAGALEKRIKSKRGEGPPVSLTHRLNARAIASSPCSPRVATPPCHLPADLHARLAACAPRLLLPQ
jgi:hypothetical protein